MEPLSNGSSDTRDKQDVSMREIIYLCYGIAVLVVSIATLGGGGVRPGLTVIAFWACIFAVPRRVLRALLMIPLACLAIVIALLPLSLHGPNHQEATRRMSCGNNLKHLAMALHNYHDQYKSLPPAYVKSDDGRRMHSWRVLILPYLEDHQQQLYDAYNFDEPWDSPSNRELIPRMPQVFCCPSQCRRGSEPTGFTNYFAVVGENTAWPGELATRFADITDGTSNTLLLLEVANRSTAWTEPADIQYADALKILTSNQPAPHRYEEFFYDQRGGNQIAMADGSVYFVAQQADQVASKLLITRNDGQRFSVDALQNNLAPPRPLHMGNCIRLGVLLLLVVLPFPWVWIKPHRVRHVPA